MKIISHRGNGIEKLKENSKEAIKKSLEKEYIDGVEFDIRLTKDNKFVLSHNPIYKNKIINKTLSKYIKLDYLEEILSSIKTKKIVLIDIKCEVDNIKKIARKLIKVLKKYSYLNIYLGSFNYKLVNILKKKSNYKIGLIISNLINRNKNIDIFDFLMIKYNVKEIYNKEIMIWTVNDKKSLEKYKDKNLYIITDKPYKIML